LVGAAPHSISADDKSFDSGVLHAGATFRHTFPATGSFTYGCLVHAGMRGRVDVVTPGAAAVAIAGDGETSSVSASDPTTPSDTVVTANTSAANSQRAARVASTSRRANDRPFLLYGLIGIAATVAAMGAMLAGIRRFLASLTRL
jgi:hypothetical protein